MWSWTRVLRCLGGGAIYGRRRQQSRNATRHGVAAVVQELEVRIVPTSVTAYEEYFLTLINQARANPTAEAASLGIDLNQGLSPGTLPPGARQPLALNDDLQASIEGHLTDELANNYFSHTGSNGSTFAQRIDAAGYTGWTNLGENLGIEYSSGALSITQSVVLAQFDALFVDANEPGVGHRVNILNDNFAEVGSAVQAGRYQGDNAVDVGNDFGARPGNSILTGVIYNDSVTANDSYDVGEGIGGATVTVVGGGNSYQTTANSAGGYQVALPAGTYSVTFSGTGISTPITKTFTIGTQNVEVDANTRVDIVAGGPPALSGTNPISYASGSAATSIDSSITVSDAGRSTLSTATITITNFVAGQDALGFVANSSTMGNIVASSNSNGVLNLSSSGTTATLAQWQAALRAVTYSNSSSNPSTTTRNVTFVVNDGNTTHELSNTLPTTIAVTASQPQLSAIEATPVSYYILATPAPITSSLVVSNPTNGDITGATVKILSGDQSGADVLSFVNTALITGAFNSTNGTITLTGSDTAADYQAALRSVLFSNTSSTATAGLRTITFQVSDGTGTNNQSNTVSRGVSVLADSGTPTITGFGPTVTYVPQAAAVTPAPSLVITQPDGLNIASAMVTFTNWQDGDQIQWFNTYALQRSFTQNLTTNTATLTLSGINTAAHYQATLQSLVFWETAGLPVTWIQREATLSVTDVASHTVSANMNIRVNDVVNGGPPVVSGTGAPITYVSNSSPVTLFPSLSITQPNGLNLYGATVTFTNWQDGDQIQWSNSFALGRTFTQNLATNTATLTLTGSNTVAHYLTTLQSIQFLDVAGAPVTWLQRVATLTVTDVDGNTATANQNVRVNQTVNAAPPALTGVNGTVNYVKSVGPITVAPNLLVAQPNNLNIYSATVTFTNWQDGDQIQWLNSFALQRTFTQNLATNTATLTLTGFDPASDYQATLRSIMFYAAAGNLNTTTRSATITVSDINANTASGSQNITVSN